MLNDPKNPLKDQNEAHAQKWNQNFIVKPKKDVEYEVLLLNGKKYRCLYYGEAWWDLDAEKPWEAKKSDSAVEYFKEIK